MCCSLRFLSFASVSAVSVLQILQSIPGIPSGKLAASLHQLRREAVY